MSDCATGQREAPVLVLESRQRERRSDWLRKGKGVFRGTKEPRGPLVEEWTRDRLKQSLDWLQRERTSAVVQDLEEAEERNLSVHGEVVQQGRRLRRGQGKEKGKCSATDRCILKGRNYKIKVSERKEALANQTDQNKHREGAQ